jgi:hypothetical protein
MEQAVNQNLDQQLRQAAQYVFLDRGETPSSDRAVELASELRDLKEKYVAAGDQENAKRVWALEQGLTAREYYLTAFDELLAEQYFDAWVNLERCEIALSFLGDHFPLDGTILSFISERVSQFQQIFPYKIFSSAELIIHKTRCSICGKTTSLRNPCGHVVGDIYDGEMCVREVLEAEPIGLAMVEKPLNKYTVPFLVDPETGERKDQYDYSGVRYLMERLESPFTFWVAQKTTRRHSHDLFSDLAGDDPCPCESGNTYSECCMNEEGVLRPHIELTIAGLPEELSGVEYF